MIANSLNERPIGILPSSDSIMNILTPNALLLGRTTADNPGGYGPLSSLFSRLTLVRTVEKQFWDNWTQFYAPTLVRQTKWKQPKRDMQLGDVVLVLDPVVSTFKSKYRIAQVDQVHPCQDGKVRRVTKV